MRDELTTFAAALADGLSLLTTCRDHSRDSLMALGIPDTVAGTLVKLAEVYFGETPYTRYQRGTVAAIRANRHSLPTLAAVERYTNRLKKQTDKWALRAYAASCTGTTSEIMAATRRQLREIKGPPAPLKPGTKVTRRAEGDVWTLTMHASSEEIAEMSQHIETPQDMLDLIRERESTVAEKLAVEKLAAAGHVAEKPAADTADDTGDASPIDESFTQHVVCSSCGAETEAKQVVSGLRTNVVLTLDELTEVIYGSGDDCRLKMTNGATITGRDLVTRLLADAGLVTLVHPCHGPVNLYRTQRLASDKQRLMAMAENQTCAWDGCNHPADIAEIHHLKSWKRGGNTNPDNLAIVCPYHNGVNDDDPTKPRRGRLERIDGVIRRVPPWASPYYPASEVCA